MEPFRIAIKEQISKNTRSRKYSPNTSLSFHVPRQSQYSNSVQNNVFVFHTNNTISDKEKFGAEALIHLATPESSPHGSRSSSPSTDLSSSSFQSERTPPYETLRFIEETIPPKKSKDMKPKKKSARLAEKAISKKHLKPSHKRCSNACSEHKRKHQRCPPECPGRLKEQEQQDQQEQQNQEPQHNPFPKASPSSHQKEKNSPSSISKKIKQYSSKFPTSQKLSHHHKSHSRSKVEQLAATASDLLLNQETNSSSLTMNALPVNNNNNSPTVVSSLSALNDLDQAFPRLIAKFFTYQSNPKSQHRNSMIVAS